MGVQNAVFDDAEGGLFHRRWLGQGTDVVISFAGMATALGGDLRLEGLQPIDILASNRDAGVLESRA